MNKLSVLLTALVASPLLFFSAGCHDCPVEHEECTTEVVMGGVDDNFAPGNVEEATPSAAMLDFMNYQYRVVPNNYLNKLTTKFDETTTDRAFGHTLTLPDAESGKWKNITSAILTIRLKVFGDNDGMNIVDADAGGEMKSLYGVYLTTLTSSPYGEGEVLTLTFDLTSMPVIPGDGQQENILDALRDGEISVYVQDDTYVDFVRLEASTYEDLR